MVSLDCARRPEYNAPKMRLFLFLTACLIAGLPLHAADPSSTDGMVPFVVPFRMSNTAPKPDWIERPAGKQGPIQSRDGHFYAGDKRMRFWGVNVCWGACFPSREEARAAAAELAGLGVNLVRIHKTDSTVPKGSFFGDNQTGTRRLDPYYMDRFDYFVAQLKAAGIYFDIDLFVDRRFQRSDGEVGSDWDRSYKAAVVFDPDLRALQKEFAKQFLDHRNPYTGLAYRDEPALAIIGIANETSLYYQWCSGKIDELGPYFGPELDRLFNAHLTKIYGGSGALSEAWGRPEELGKVVRPKLGDKGKPVQDFFRFAWEVEHDYFTDMCRYVKNDLGYKGCISGSMAFGLYGVAINRDFDYIDMHSYWNNPTYLPGGGHKVNNRPIVDKPTLNSFEMLSVGRLKGKPFAVTEINHAFPGYYDAEMIPLAAAYAANQDWDALVLFDFHASTQWHSDRIRNFFEIDGHPAKTVQMLAGSAAFLRGDVPSAPGYQVLSVTQPDAVDIAVNNHWLNNSHALRKRGITPDPHQRFYVEFGKATAVAVKTAGINDCFQWAAEDGQGVVRVTSPGTLMAIGRIAGKQITLGDATVAIGSTATGHAAVTVTALDTSDIATARRVLLTATARCANTGMVWAEDERSVTKWGEAPALAETVPLDIDLPGAWRAYALNPDGSKASELPSETTAASTGLSLAAPTIWYALERS